VSTVPLSLEFRCGIKKANSGAIAMPAQLELLEPDELEVNAKQLENL